LEDVDILPIFAGWKLKVNRYFYIFDKAAMRFCVL